MSSKMHYYEFDIWQRTIGAHFYLQYNSSYSTGGAADSHMYLLKGLLGLSQDQASRLFWELSTEKAIIGRHIPDPLIDFVCREYPILLNRDVSDIIFIKTIDDTIFRAFIQSATGNKSIIDVWTSASAVCAAVAIVFAQFFESLLAKQNFSSNSKEAQIEDAVLIEKLSALNRLTVQWSKNNSIQFDIHTQLELKNPNAIKRARVYFLEAFSFVILHEIAHHFLGHLKQPVSSIRESHDQELHADVDAIKCLSLSGKAGSRIGPLLVYIAASLLSQEEDNIASSTHPSLVDRTAYYFTTLELLERDKSDIKDWISRFLWNGLISIFCNMDDRDRLPAWCGITREEFFTKDRSVAQVQSDPLNFKDAPFESYMSFRMRDMTRPAPIKRKLDFI